jgi:hydroxypyruvate isomerase
MFRFAANLSFLFTEHDFLDRFEAAARAGFGGVEYHFPYQWEARDLAARLHRSGLAQVLFNLPAGKWAKGERGLAILPDRVEEFRAGVESAIAYATALNCPQVNCLAGVVPAGADREVLHGTFVRNLQYAASKMKAAGLRLLIEPINTRDIPGFYLSRSAQALDIIAEVGADNLFLQYDIYHMQIMEGDLAHTLKTNLDRIGHIQIADAPGRHEPGSGEINYPFLFEQLDAWGYEGWVACEYIPATTTAEGLDWLAPYLR